MVRSRVYKGGASLESGSMFDDLLMIVVCARRNFGFNDIHVQGARNIARACRDAGVERLIHVSALGASADSPSTFLKAKACNCRSG